MTDKVFDIAAFKKVGMIQQKQKEYFALRLHAVAGDFTAEQMQKIAEVAVKYGTGQIHCSTRQGIEIHNVHHTNLEAARAELESVGVAMGACGPRIRIVTGCPGARTCRWGIIDTKEVAARLDRTWFREETPHKFKMAVTGCPHNCAKATENDIGVMGGIVPGWVASSCTDCGLCVNICPTHAIEKAGDEYVVDLSLCINCSICTSSCPAGAWVVVSRGYILWIGGTMGKVPRLATRLGGLIESKERLYELVGNAIDYYRRMGRKKERFGHMIDRIGPDVVSEAILNGR
ncbi:MULTISPECIES: 4Fe-4S binding protein [unclassified Methanoculleus]|jgi:dissimilatory sulfite reductase (desulfoviridin) alpha/beta subunit|uniref:4Fe-4S binding protein n=1 Tax=unclassified Methanoculleus TaxID=2619537 RepID=UPI00319EA7DB